MPYKSGWALSSFIHVQSLTKSFIVVMANGQSEVLNQEPVTQLKWGQHLKHHWWLYVKKNHAEQPNISKTHRNLL